MMYRCNAVATDKSGGMKQWSTLEAKDFLQSISSQYISTLTDILQVKPEDNILDIGCGPGTMAVPLARIAKSVTAIDTSVGMLETLKEEAEKNGLRNINCVNKFWRDVEVGIDITDTYDVVIASNSINLLGAKEAGADRKQLDWDLSDAIAKINTLKGKNCATMPLLEHKINDVYELLGRQYSGFPDHIIVHNVLFQMGLKVGVDYFVIQDNKVHQNRLLSERVSWILNLNNTQRNHLEDTIQRRVKVSDRRLQVWSLIQWIA
ncbi:MAG: hypothetical protein QG670_512 [Thermoproteota archaeon]|nr:hypothetical protein [Thermoproteota archaeon]